MRTALADAWQSRAAEPATPNALGLCALREGWEGSSHSVYGDVTHAHPEAKSLYSCFYSNFKIRENINHIIKT